MQSFQPKDFGRGFRLLGTVRVFLVLFLGLLAVSAIQAQTYNWKSVQIRGGGFVTGILFHPDEPGLMYCRTDIGGSYRWNPTNDTWISLLDFVGYPNNEWSLIGTESIGLDAQDPNRLYFSCGWLGNPSQIMISTNRGASFTRINSPFVIRANNDGRGTGERFGVDPNLGSTVFYGTRENGLWKSVNYAANWAKVNSFPVNTTPNGVGISFVEFIRNSGTPGSATPVMWVGVSQTGTNLFRSTDGGVTWTGIATNGVPTNCIPLRAAQDGLGNMYITFCDAAGPGGISTGVVRKFNLTTLTSINVTPPTGQGGYGGVSVDRQNPNRIVVTTANRWWPVSDIYRSTNGGTNWTSVYNGTVDTSSAPWMGSGGGNIVQGWMFDVKIDPYNSNRVYYVTGGGIFSSYNFTAATPTWQFRSTGLEENAFTGVGNNLASPPSGPKLWSVLGDMGGFSHYELDASPALTNFHNPNGANNYGIDFAEQSPNIVGRTYNDFNGGRGGYISSNYGRTWSLFPTTPPPVQSGGPGYVAISADGNRMVWTISGSAPYYSTDGGATWNPCAGAPTPSETWEEPFNFSDRVNPNKFYLYYRNTGRVFVSTDGGANFNLASTISAWGDSMRPAYGQEGSLWVAVYDGLWRTTNSGASFFKVPGVQAAHVVGFGRTATGTGHPVVYLHGQIGGVWGIYRSENQGTNWTRINDNQHQFGTIQNVIGDPKTYGRCYIAAGGRGILYGDIPNQPPFTPANLVATPSSGAVQLSWDDAVGADSYIVKRSTTSGSGYAILTNGLAATSYLDTGLASGTTYYYVVAATNSFGVSADSAEVSATPLGPVPPPWQTQDIGAVGIAGSALYGSGVFSVTGAGGDIQGTADAFRFTYVTATGDCTIIARVVSVQNIDAWSKAGVMIRAGLGANAANAFIALTPGNGVTWQYRSSTGGNTDWNQTTGLSAPYWIKLVRSGNIFTGYRSPDGNNWTEQGSLTNVMPANVYVGLALTSHNSSSPCTATFDNVTAPGWPLPNPPAAPTGLAAVRGDGSVALSWSASATATSYYVKRSTTSGTGYINIATNASLSFTNTGLANGTLYYFVVSGVNAGGAGADSLEVSARPTSFAAVALSAIPSPGSIQLNWPQDHTGWQLQAQTNSLAVGLGPNWSTIAGSAQTNQITLPLNATEDAVFFRLMRPY
jgi:hypothetical protein